MAYSDGSVSRGVFVKRGKKRRADSVAFISKEKGSDNEERQNICEHTWEIINDRVQILRSDSNTKIFEDLLDFVKRAYRSENGQNSGNSVSQEIPTAALVTGVNSPDHAVMFHNLHTMLKERLTPFVAELRSKDCFNVKATISKAVSELMGATHLVEDEGLAEDQPNLKKINPTISVLAKWYQDKVKSRSPMKNSSPRKRKTSSSPKNKPVDGVSSDSSTHRPPVVIIFEDLEAFSPNVLQDFITICSNHLSDLPVVLVFGIATSVTTVHRLLSNAASSLLCIEKFQAPPSSDYLSLVIDQVVMTHDISFKLGPKVFNLLLDLFLFHDFSVINFIRNFQFALLDHFYSHQYSIVCNDLKEATETVNSMTEKQLKCIQDLPSFQKFLESRDAKSPLKNSRDIKKTIVGMLKKLTEYHNCYFPVLRCLHAFAAKLPKYPLGKQVRELYARSISSNICDTEEYVESIALMKSLSREELILLLNESYNNLQSDILSTEFSEIREKLQYYIEKFDNIEELQKQADQERDAAASEEVALPEKTNLHTLRQTLQNMEMKKKKLSVYESLRNDLINYIDTLFKEYLMPPSSLPLHEIFYYNNVSEMRLHVNGSPRATIQWGLADPHHYLQHDSLKADGDNILGTLPDVCIAYKLHLECGRLINLYDWLQAFMTIASSTNPEGGSTSKKSKKANEQSSRVLQARFIRAVSELQFLGFIKPTKRKTDHVARLTWGGC